MSETPPIPDDLETCQQQLRELLQVHEELLATCGSMQDSQQKLPVGPLTTHCPHTGLPHCLQRAIASTAE